MIETSPKPNDESQTQNKEMSLDISPSTSEAQKRTSEEERIRIAEHVMAHGYKKTIEILSEELNRPMTMGILNYALKWYKNSDKGNSQSFKNTNKIEPRLN